MDNRRIEIKDFTVGQKAYILYLHTGYNRPAEIFETTVKKVGSKYVTVTHFEKRFRRCGDEYGLTEYSDYGELGILFNSREDADKERKRHILIMNVRNCIDIKLNSCSYEDLKQIMEILK